MAVSRQIILGVTLVILQSLSSVRSQLEKTPPYVKQCRSSDPKITECFIQALHHLKPYLAKGIPEIEMPSVEPFRMDELSLSLTSGPNGYRITLKDLDIFGLSNFTVAKIKLSSENTPFETRIKIPELKINARYTSSGVLIILPASGNGTFHAKLGDIMAIVRGTVNSYKKNGLDYLNVDQLTIDLNIKNVNMHVKKVFNNNRILIEATNLFLRENGHEVLNVMMPQLRTKLSSVVIQISNQLLKHVPTQMYLLP